MRKSTETVFDRFPELRTIPDEKYPKHIFIIPDGNGRWAKERNGEPIVGHLKGYEALRRVLDDLHDLPINTVTVWGFASDNWKRPKSEVDALMQLFEEGIDEILPDLEKKGDRFVHLGRKDRIPDSLKKVIDHAEEVTRENKNKNLAFAIDFGGADQELRMLKAAQILPRETEIDGDLVKKLRDGQGIISPADLIIRTSGEMRTSDAGWLVKNAEFFSIQQLMPDVETKHFVRGIVDFSKRERRLGGRPTGKINA